MGLLVVGTLCLLLGAGLLGDVLPVTASPDPVPSVGRQVPVTATDQLAQPSNNSPAIVAEPGNSRFMVMANRIDAPDFSCALQVSGDGGASWLSANPVPKLPEGAEKCYAPEADFDADGVLVYHFAGLRGRGNEPIGVFLTTSTDRGRTFSAPRQVLGPQNFGARMAIDRTMGPRGRIHMVWLHAGEDPGLGAFGAAANTVMAAHSDDGGQTFSEPVKVSDSQRARVVGPGVTLGADHQVHVAYYDLKDDARDYLGVDGPTWEGTWSLVVTSSLNAGGQFQPGSVVDEVVPFERPILILIMPPAALVADGSRLCTSWADGRNGDADVLLRCTGDGGRSWEPVVRLNDDNLGNGARQYLPRLSVAPGGRIDAIFLDRRFDPERAHYDVTYTFSTDGGRHFGVNRKITSEPSLVTNGARYGNVSALGQYEVGGRLGLLSSRSSVMAAWPDTRNSVDGTGHDVFATTVRFPTRHQPGWARLAGALLMAAGLGMVWAAVRRHGRPSASGAIPSERLDQV